MRESLALMAPPPIDISFQTEKPVSAAADEAQVQQIVVNLVRNGIDAMEALEQRVGLV